MESVAGVAERTREGDQGHRLGYELGWGPGFLSALPKFQWPAADDKTGIAQELAAQREEIKDLRRQLELIRHELQEQRSVLKSQYQLGEFTAREVMATANHMYTSLLDNLEQRLKGMVGDEVQRVLAVCEPPHRGVDLHTLDMDRALLQGALKEAMLHSFTVKRDALRRGTLRTISSTCDEHHTCAPGVQALEGTAEGEAFQSSCQQDVKFPADCSGVGNETLATHRGTAEDASRKPQTCNDGADIPQSDSHVPISPSLTSRVFEAVLGTKLPQVVPLSAR